MGTSSGSSKTNSRSSGPVLRSLSTTDKKHDKGAGSSWSSPTSAFSTSSLASSRFYNRSSSPTRVNLHNTSKPSNPVPSVRFSLDRSVSPRRTTITVSSSSSRGRDAKKSCMCSPTTHPGSFRCSLHKHLNNIRGYTTSYSSNGLNLQRSAMKNSLVRIGTVEGDLVKRALAALIRPSSHQQRRRAAFQPKPSRLSRMTRADDRL